MAISSNHLAAAPRPPKWSSVPIVETPLKQSTSHSFIRWAERCLLCLLICYFGVRVMPRAWNGLITDFPNYYLAARLAHEGYDTSRMYEWQWFEREKDHRAVEVRVIGLVPITPFSTLVMWPIAGLPPLTAKRVWILFSLLTLVPIGLMLRSMTGLSYERIGLAFVLSVPFYRNLEFGQFYVLLLLLIVAACWAYLRGWHVLAGVLVAIAAACKIFPLLLFVFFLQRRAWRALSAGIVTGAIAATLSLAVFGFNVHRTYVNQILPWAMHGEAMPPYVTSASISGILHILFLSEPSWNPHPWHSSVLCYALLMPLLSTLLLAPAILLIRRDDTSSGRILLEWSALLTATLTVSTIPASYNFVLMVMPMCVLSAILLARRQYGWLAALLIAYIGIGYPVSSPPCLSGLAILLYTPRLPLMIAMLLGIYALLWRGLSSRFLTQDWPRLAWAALMLASIVFTARSTFFRERAVRQEYAFRLPLPSQGLSYSSPQPTAAGIRYIEFAFDGYHLISNDPNLPFTNVPRNPLADDLSFSSAAGRLWIESAADPSSTIVDVQYPSRAVVNNARNPMPSADGLSLAFVRDYSGRGRLILRPSLQTASALDLPLTPTALNVYEATFISSSLYAFSASDSGQPPRLYLTDASHSNAPLDIGEARYPALSPDGAWLAYSRLEHGVWNLWIRDQKTGATRRVGDVPCNQIQPAWENDSRMLVYSTDCGRGLWFTAIARRRLIP